MKAKLILLLAVVISFAATAPVKAAIINVEVGDRPYYLHGPGYYVGPRYYVWIPGHWAWRHHQRVWIHGHYRIR